MSGISFLTKEEAKGLEQKVLDEVLGGKENEQNLNKINSYSDENPNADSYREAVSDDLWNETLKRLGL